LGLAVGFGEWTNLQFEKAKPFGAVLWRGGWLVVVDSVSAVMCFLFFSRYKVYHVCKRLERGCWLSLLLAARESLRLAILGFGVRLIRAKFKGLSLGEIGLR
jgi:hypothetical protein